MTYRSTQGRFGPSVALVGTFRLVFVLTSETVKRPEDRVSVSSLDLTLADSAQRAASRLGSVGHRPRGDLRLIGVMRDTSAVRGTEVEVDGSLLYVGCRDCMDASPTVLRIVEVNERGFFGSWRNSQTGIGRFFDERTGMPLPDPTGYFCAWRR